MEKSLNIGYIVRFKHSSSFSQQKFMLICNLKIYGKWVCCFNNGRGSIENDPRVGRPVSVFTEKNNATVKMLIEEDASYTMQEIEELSGIRSSSF
jgi:hypothetical protein